MHQHLCRHQCPLQHRQLCREPVQVARVLHPWHREHMLLHVVDLVPERRRDWDCMVHDHIEHRLEQESRVFVLARDAVVV